MKKCILFLFAAMLMGVAVTAFANPVEPDRAVQVAHRFMGRSVGADLRQSQIARTVMMPKTGRPAFYVVNVGGKAFVIVAADDAARPILGYSRTSAFPTAKQGREERLPDNIQAFFDDMAAQVEYASQHPEQGRPYFAQQWQQANAGLLTTTLAADSVGPLLTTTWDQGQYYNDLCPGGAPTGCVATAMAQIINYHQYPTTGRGYHEYLSLFNGVLSVNYDSATYDYSLMPAALTATSSAEEVSEVAKLMYHCGVATNTQYSFSESGARSQAARSTLVNHFKYDKSIGYITRQIHGFNNWTYADSVIHYLNDFYSDDEWFSIIKNELLSNRPILYSAEDIYMPTALCPGGVGHAFVCDGFNDSNYFHFNWGWGGSADGYYVLSALSPSIYEFNYGHSAVVGIKPGDEETHDYLYGIYVIDDSIKNRTTPVSRSKFTIKTPIHYGSTMLNNWYSDSLNNVTILESITFYPQDSNAQLEINTLRFQGESFKIFYGDDTNSLIYEYTASSVTIDFTPIVSSRHALTLICKGIQFEFLVSEWNGCTTPHNDSVIEDSVSAIIAWTEYGDATQWQIEYGISGFSHGNGQIVTVSQNPCNLTGLTKLTQYDLYVRAVCSDSIYSRWSNKITFRTSAPFWTDIVTTQPEGYVEDPLGNVTISSAEGLAWLSVVTNGLHGEPFNVFEGKRVRLTADIDLAGYKWIPIASKLAFLGEFDGENHVIKNMYVHYTGDNYRGLL